MTPTKIQEMLSLGEGQRVEFKSTARNVEALGRVVCGFLNTSGGYLICGVGDRGAVPGVDASPDAVAGLEKKMHEGISPRALVSIQAQPLAEKTVIVIEVPAGQDVPYAFRDVIYLRSGEFTQKADAETIRDIVMRRQIEPERWERRFSFAEVETEMEPDEVRAAVSEAQNVSRAFFRDPAQPLMVLEDFNVAKYGRLTNAGDVLFTRNPAARLPQIRIRAIRYNSDKAGDTFSDMKSIEGPLHTIFEEAYSFIVRNTPSVSHFIKGNPKRQDSTLYPADAVREAIINALAHRDYSAASGGVSIHVFPRRLEIWNSGALPDGVTEENLPKGHISVLRNPDLAHVLYLRGLMEKAGRGSVLMVQQCRKNGLPDPVWKSDAKLGVTLTFRAPEVTLEETQQVRDQAWPPSGPSRDQVDVLRNCLAESSIGNLMSVVGRSNRTKFRDHVLKPLLESGIIEMTIPGKPTSSKQKYRLTAKGQAVLKTVKR
ncbi:MAG: RNA-binding domain-containing protein [bacterium]